MSAGWFLKLDPSLLCPSIRSTRTMWILIAFIRFFGRVRAAARCFKVQIGSQLRGIRMHAKRGNMRIRLLLRHMLFFQYLCWEQ